MTSRVTSEQIAIAILWLESNEGGGEEEAACKAVAERLKAEQQDRTVRAVAREHKVPIATARAAIAKATGAA